MGESSSDSSKKAYVDEQVRGVLRWRKTQDSRFTTMKGFPRGVSNLKIPS